MSANVETMAYNKVERPWHGLGVPVEADLTPDEMLKVAGVDWTVSKRPMYVTNGGKLTESENDVKYNGKLYRVEDQYALVRDSDDSILSTVGSRYKPVQNANAVDFFTKFVKAGGMTMETMGSLSGGRYVWGLARIGKGFKIGKSDENEGYLLLAHPHIFGQSMILQTTAVRVVCWNTYSAALQSGNNRWSMRHSQEFGDVKKSEAEAALGIAVEQFTEFGEMAKFLAKKKAKDDQVKQYFLDVLQLKEKPANDAGEVKELRQMQRINEIYENAQGQGSARGNWWGAFNAITFLTDHAIGREADGRLARAWFGDRALMKRAALKSAIEYAEAA